MISLFNCLSNKMEFHFIYLKETKKHFMKWNYYMKANLYLALKKRNYFDS